VNNGVVTGKVPSEGGTYFFCAKLPAIASMGNNHQEPPRQHGQADSHVVPQRIHR
jgi:hypothetical protein